MVTDGGIRPSTSMIPRVSLSSRSPLLAVRVAAQVMGSGRFPRRQSPRRIDTHPAYENLVSKSKSSRKSEIAMCRRAVQ